MKGIYEQRENKEKKNFIEMKSKLDENSTSYVWAQNLGESTLIALHNLIKLFTLRFKPQLSGIQGVGDEVNVFMEKEDIEQFEKYFPLKKERDSVRKGSNSSYPWQKGEYTQKRWIIKDKKIMLEFLSIFQDLKPEKELIYCIDQVNTCEKKKLSKEEYSTILRENKLADYKSKFSSGDAYIYKAKMLVGKKKPCSKHLAYFSINWIEYPIPIMNLKFFYQRFRRGMTVDVPKNRTKRKETKENTEKKKKKKESFNQVRLEINNSIVEKHNLEKQESRKRELELLSKMIK